MVELALVRASKVVLGISLNGDRALWSQFGLEVVEYIFILQTEEPSSLSIYCDVVSAMTFQKYMVIRRGLVFLLDGSLDDWIEDLAGDFGVTFVSQKTKSRAIAAYCT